MSIACSHHQRRPALLRCITLRLLQPQRTCCGLNSCALGTFCRIARHTEDAPYPAAIFRESHTSYTSVTYHTYYASKQLLTSLRSIALNGDVRAVSRVAQRGEVCLAVSISAVQPSLKYSMLNRDAHTTVTYLIAVTHIGIVLEQNCTAVDETEATSHHETGPTILSKCVTQPSIEIVYYRISNVRVRPMREQ